MVETKAVMMAVLRVANWAEKKAAHLAVSLVDLMVDWKAE